MEEPQTPSPLPNSILFTLQNRSINAPSSYAHYNKAPISPTHDSTPPISKTPSLPSHLPSSPPKNFKHKLSQTLLPRFHFSSKYCCDTRIYGGQFSSDGSLFYSTSQETIKLFNTEDPFNWKVIKTIEGQEIEWTITDSDLDPKQQMLIYSSINTTAFIIRLNGFQVYPVVFSSLRGRLTDNMFGRSDEFFGIWSLKFSPDSCEVLAGGTGGLVLVYDLNKGKVHMKVQKHLNDVNSVCWANREHSNLIYTGSDDCFCYVWDRRILHSKQRPSGVLVGHHEGITHVSSKGDDIHLITNGKDSLLKMWDIRKMHDLKSLPKMPALKRCRGFDYRWKLYPLRNKTPIHPYDTSLHTFKSHYVLQTLIRCYYSPLHTTNQRYIYTGSADGRIYLFDTVTLEALHPLEKMEYGNSFYYASDDEFEGTYGLTGQNMLLRRRQNTPVRDVSWHPHLPVLASTSFSRHVDLWKWHPQDHYLNSQLLDSEENSENDDSPQDDSFDFFD